MGHSGGKKATHKGVSRSELLPLPASMVRTISLQNHLALEALRSRHGASLHATFLFRAVYLTYLLGDASEPRREIDMLHQAEVLLCRCSQRAENGNSWLLDDSEIDAIKQVLTLHDRQLQAISTRCYETACAELLNYLLNGGQPGIPDSRAGFSVQDVEFAR